MDDDDDDDDYDNDDEEKDGDDDGDGDCAHVDSSYNQDANMADVRTNQLQATPAEC